MSDRTAIAGGRGFLGKHLCAAIPGAVGFGREGPPGSGCEALIWAAGGRSGSSDDLHEQHAAAPARIIAAMRPRRVVYLSSAEVYGRQPVPFLESTIVAPITEYGRAKFDGEQAVTTACATICAQLIVLRLAVIYGPDQTPTMLIPAALAALRAGQPFPTSHGTQTRDFLHVDDLVALVRRCLAADAPPDVYNAGSGREVSIGHVLRTLAAMLGHETANAADAAGLLQFGAREPRPGEATRYVLDVRRAHANLGWSAAVDLEVGLRRLAAC